MSKDKEKKLVKYLDLLKTRLADHTPVKHASHPETFRVFLVNEIETVQRQLAEHKLESTGR